MYKKPHEAAGCATHRSLRRMKITGMKGDEGV